MNTPRRIHRLAVALAALAISLAVASSASAAVSQLDPYQWNLNTSAPQASTYNADYGVFSMRNNQFLTGHHRTLGVDLDWGDGKHVTTGLRLWSFQRKSGVAGPIMPGERVAMVNNFTHRFLGYGHENFGINLDYTNYPVYDWQVAVSNGRISLYNTDGGDYVVYGARPFGINLMWLKDLAKQVSGSVPGNRTTTVYLRAQPVISGFIPYLGSFGGGYTSYPGTLQSVTNPYNGVALSFVKPGHSTTECGNPSAVVPLGPGATMTSAQRIAAFGSSTPTLPVTFLACVTAAPNVNTVALNIGYYGLS